MYLQLDNPEPDIEDAVNYPNVRTFFTDFVTSNTPLEDLSSVVRPWVIPTAGEFSVRSRWPIDLLHRGINVGQMPCKLNDVQHWTLQKQ